VSIAWHLFGYSKSQVRLPDVIIVVKRPVRAEIQFISEELVIPYAMRYLLLKVLRMIAQPACRKLANAAAFMLLLGLGACSWAPPERVDPHSSHEAIAAGGSTGHRAAAVALQQVGIRYRYGGATPHGFDCSGLVQYAYASVGTRVPRTTGQLWSQLQPVEPRDLQPGDVLFFNIEGKMAHVGLYVGDSQFVHAPSTGRTVTVAKLDAPFYEASLIRAGRPR